MQKRFSDVKKGDRILIAGEELLVHEAELSDIGKQGTRKCRLVVSRKTGEKITLIRPADYPVDVR